MPLQTDTMTLVLMLTDACNLRCAHCFKSNRSLAETPLPAVEKVLSGLKKLFGNLHVSVSGGEPTLHSRFEEVLALLDAQSQTYHVVTNGLNFSRRTLPLLLRHRRMLQCVAFSLDGGDAETHDRIRGRGSFARAMEALVLCREHGLGTRLCATLSKLNLNQVDPIRRLERELCISHGVFLWPAVPTRRLAEQGALLDRADLEYLARRAEQLEGGCVSLIGDLHRMDEHYEMCEPLSLRQFTLDADGNLSLCCNLTHYAGETDRRDVLGSALREDMATLVERHLDMAAAYKKAMLREFAGGLGDDAHAYACAHCARYHGKLDWLEGGRQVIQGVPFEVADPRGEKLACIALRSFKVKATGERELPARVTIELGRKVRALYFLHGCGWGAHKKAGQYRMLYDDGTQAAIDILPYGSGSEHLDVVERMRKESTIQDWWPSLTQIENDRLRHVIVANPENLADKRYLYNLRWQNASPGKTVKTIELESDPTLSTSLFVVAITAELAE